MLTECIEILNNFKQLLKKNGDELMPLKYKFKEILLNYQSHLEIHDELFKEIYKKVKRCLFIATRDEIFEDENDIEPSGTNYASLQEGFACIKEV